MVLHDITLECLCAACVLYSKVAFHGSIAVFVVDGPDYGLLGLTNMLCVENGNLFSTYWRILSVEAVMGRIFSTR